MAPDYKGDARRGAIDRDRLFASRNPGTAELRRFIREFDKFPAELRRELRPKLKATGERILLKARSNAAWSTRVPTATRLKVSLAKKTAGVSIEVNRKKAPHARPFEHRGRPGAFRHPVFWRQGVGQTGVIKNVWVSQPARPFLTPAAAPEFARVDAEIGRVVAEAADKSGFK